MTEEQQKELGKVLWSIADKLRGAMSADDFRDYMLAFLFLRYISDNYEESAQAELGKDFPASSRWTRKTLNPTPPLYVAQLSSE